MVVVVGCVLLVVVSGRCVTKKYVQEFQRV